MFPDLPKDACPVNLFMSAQEMHQKFRLSLNANILDAKLDEGDCIYIPAYYYVQSKTNSDESILLSQEFEPHSQFVDLIFEAVEQGTVTDDKSHEWDAAMAKFIGAFY